jgi:hypothetical protein
MQTVHAGPNKKNGSEERHYGERFFVFADDKNGQAVHKAEPDHSNVLANQRIQPDIHQQREPNIEPHKQLAG